MRVVDENMEVIVENMGSSMKVWGSLMKVWGSSTKVWGLSMRILGSWIERQLGRRWNGVVDGSSMMMISSLTRSVTPFINCRCKCTCHALNAAKNDIVDLLPIDKSYCYWLCLRPKVYSSGVPISFMMHFLSPFLSAGQIAMLMHYQHALHGKYEWRAKSSLVTYGCNTIDCSCI